MSTTEIPSNPFGPELFELLRELAANNDREWFLRNRERYEDAVLEPALRFISDFGPALRQISPHFLAVPKRVGGSLFRIHRDTRFARDKRPYKTHVGIQFRHRQGKDVHAPGFYLHLQPGQVFVGVGMWHPDSASLRRIRDAIVESPEAWKAVRADAAFNARLQLGGDSLKRPPRGYDPDHPLVEDLKRKDFVAAAGLSEADATAPGFPSQVAALCHAGAPLVRFLCEAVGVAF